MAEPPAQNYFSTSSHQDPPIHHTSLDRHLAKHRDLATATPRSIDGDASSLPAAASASGASYNASRRSGYCGGDAPSVGASIHSGSDDASVRSEFSEASYRSYNASRESREEETVRLLSGAGGSRREFPNPYKKKKQHQQEQQSQRGKSPQGNRVSFAEQLFGRTYDSNSTVIGSMVGSITGSIASSSPSVRRKVPRVSSNGASAANGDVATTSSSSPSSSTSSLMAKRLMRFAYIKKNATILSMLALGMMIAIGGVFNLTASGSSSTASRQEPARGLDYDAASAPKGGIMNDFHPPSAQHPGSPLRSSPGVVASSSSPEPVSAQRIDWNKVPPHLRGYYSKAFGPPPENRDDIPPLPPSYGEADDYEHTQFANADQAKAIHSVGQEAVLGFRPMTGRDYHAQGQLNAELTGGGLTNGGGFNDGPEQVSSQGGGGGVEGFDVPTLGKEAFASQEQQASRLRGGAPPVVPQGFSDPAGAVVDSEEQKRLDAQEAALAKAATAEDDARKRRQDELAQLRASNGLTGSYYPEKQGPNAEGAAVDSQNVNRAQESEGGENYAQEDEQQQLGAGSEEENARQKELEREVEAEAEKILQQAEEAAANAQQNEEAERQRKEEMARQEAQREDENRIREEEAARQREEEAARQREEEVARQREEEAARQREEEAARQREEEAARQREEEAARQREEEAARQREEEMARQQELARQEAMEKEARQKLEAAKQKEEGARQSSMAQQLLAKFLSVPFKEQTKEIVAPPPPPPAEKQPDPLEPSEQQQQVQPQERPDQTSQEQPAQNLPDLSEWRSGTVGKFQERIQAGAKVDQNASKGQSQALLTEIPRQKENPHGDTQYRLQIERGELSFDEWRSKIKQKLHKQIQEERAKNAPHPPNQGEVKNMVSQKLEEVEQAQKAVMNGESSDLDSIASLQKELSELLSLMGGN